MPEDLPVRRVEVSGEAAGRIPIRQAVILALECTGSTVTSAGLVLAGTFGVFALAVAQQPGSAPYTSILATLAIGILMDAFAVRTLLVPAAVALLGRWSWWPANPGAPAHGAQRIGEGRLLSPPVCAGIAEEGEH